jgi:hypothetical protein
MLFWDEEKKSISLTTNIWQNDRMNYNPLIQTFDVKSNPLLNELTEFVECVTEGRRPISDVDNAIDVAKNLDLLVESSSH